MARHTKQKDGGTKKWKYLLYACFLIVGALLIAGLPQYYRLRSNGKLEAMKALDRVCNIHNVKIIDLRYLVLGLVSSYGFTDSDTPAGKVEYFMVDMLPDSSIPDDLQLSSEESIEFSDQIWEIISEYRSEMDCPQLMPPESPYQWRMMEAPSGEHLAIWCGGTSSDQLHILSW